uniref:Uncharacterized protein n=1 Tax=Panagrolaimus sp. ES5 TaxID=591445 RepID=A0AC34GC89_9BILA
MTALSFFLQTDEDAMQFADDDTNLNIPDLKSYRKEFLKAMVFHLNRYYDNEQMDLFEIMNPSTFKVLDKSVEFEQDAMAKHRNLAKILGLNAPDISNQLKDLLENVATKKGYPILKERASGQPQIFYHKVLHEVDVTMEVSVELKQYIARVLAVPVGRLVFKIHSEVSV